MARSLKGSFGSSTTTGSGKPEPAFDPFISYSRPDIDFARKLERALEAYQPPSGLQVPRRRLRVFRDEADFTGVKYFEAVDQHLRQAAKLLVLCSPAARKSPCVDDEIRRFANHKGAAEIIPILIDGIPNNEAGQSAEDQKVFPDSLVELLQMPPAIEYRQSNCNMDKLDGKRFANSWYSLLAETYGLSTELIEQREKKSQINRRRIRTLVAAGAIVSS
jgi:hypothetical protein